MLLALLFEVNYRILMTVKADFRTIIVAGLAVAIIGGGAYFGLKSFKYAKESVPEPIDSRTLAIAPAQNNLPPRDGEAPGKEVPATEETAPVIPSLPEELNLKMTFYSQAPFGNWDYPWQEACEEASVLLVANEYLGRDWTAEEFNEEILKLVDWENETFGDYEHTSVNQTVRILNEYLDLKTLVYDDPTYEDVQKILNRGHFIVMTFAGKRLGNPFYKNGGPLYHAMVIKGYKQKEKIITSDVGTRRGEDYVYSWKTIENALHDYAEPIEDGEKRMIEVIPPTE